MGVTSALESGSSCFLRLAMVVNNGKTVNEFQYILVSMWICSSLSLRNDETFAGH